MPVDVPDSCSPCPEPFPRQQPLTKNASFPSTPCLNMTQPDFGPVQREVPPSNRVPCKRDPSGSPAPASRLPPPPGSQVSCVACHCSHSRHLVLAKQEGPLLAAHCHPFRRNTNLPQATTKPTDAALVNCLLRSPSSAPNPPVSRLLTRIPSSVAVPRLADTPSATHNPPGYFWGRAALAPLLFSGSDQVNSLLPPAANSPPH